MMLLFTAHLHSERHGDMLNQILPLLDVPTPTDDANSTSNTNSPNQNQFNWIELSQNADKLMLGEDFSGIHLQKLCRIFALSTVQSREFCF